MDFSTLAFYGALRVSGLSTLPLAFGSDGTIIGRETLTTEQQTALDALLADYDPLEGIKAVACSRINATAEALCSNLITPGQTQQTRYARKLAQAEAYLQDGTPTEAEYPLIFNEVGITASNAGAVATAIVQASEAYGTFCDTVELVRAKAKGAVRAASNASLVASAEAAVVWPKG